MDNKHIFKVSIRFSPNGGAPKSKRVIDFIINKHTLVSVKAEKDQLCGLRAIVIGKAIADGHDRDLYHPYKSYQTVEARKLAKKLNISEDTQIDLEHI